VKSRLAHFYAIRRPRDNPSGAGLAIDPVTFSLRRRAVHSILINMNDNEELKALRVQGEELLEGLRRLSEKQNAQYTDVMLKLQELKADKDQFEFVRTDMAQQIENLYDGATIAVVEAGAASASLLQRKLKIGYATAAMFIDRLEEDGIIGESDDGMPREVLVRTIEDLEKELPIFSGEEFDEEDELYGEVERLARSAGKVSTAFLQKRLRTGYARCARLVDMLEERGVIEPGQGAKPRKVIEKNAAV
jgi:DNA segregation ATPase FtsK/SpoIIIE-like protein